MKQLFFISHDTETAVQIGKSITGIATLDPKKIAAINAFLTVNHQKSIITVYDDDDVFEEILDTYTFITVDDANKSIYNNKLD
ncbi:MAG TPA: hypothetical protein VF602_03150 [Pedobacter sp.]|jgi:hypothetical protein